MFIFAPLILFLPHAFSLALQPREICGKSWRPCEFNSQEWGKLQEKHSGAIICDQPDFEDNWDLSRRNCKNNENSDSSIPSASGTNRCYYFNEGQSPRKFKNNDCQRIEDLYSYDDDQEMVPRYFRPIRSTCSLYYDDGCESIAIRNYKFSSTTQMKEPLENIQNPGLEKPGVLLGQMNLTSGPIKSLRCSPCNDDCQNARLWGNDDIRGDEYSSIAGPCVDQNPNRYNCDLNHGYRFLEGFTLTE